MQRINAIWLLTLLYTTCCIAYAAEDSDERFLVNLIWKCTRTEDLGNCLKLKAANFLDKLVRTKEPLVMTDYLSLVRDPKISDPGYQGLNYTDSQAKFLKTNAKNQNLDEIIWDKLVSLFKTRTIQLSLPSDAFEGRGKEDKIFKKGHGIFLMAGMMGGMMMKMALAKIALIAGKALIIGKIALVLSLIIALKKFTTPPVGGGPAEVVYTSSELANGRQFDGGSVRSRKDGNELAYNAHNPKTYNNL